MKVIIEGIEIYLSNKCPTCGGPREVIIQDNEEWINPCGHRELFKDILHDQKLKEEIVKQQYNSMFVGEYNDSINRTMNQMYFFPAMEEYAHIVLQRYINNINSPYTTGL